MGELLQYTFYIPDYQRGYHWTAAEVRELLNDLKEYQETRTKVLYQDIGYKKVSGHRLQKFQDIGNTFG